MDEVAAASAPGNTTPPANVAIARIVANAGQPRRRFEPGALADLVASIKDRGVLQPILVRPVAGVDGGEGRYEIVAGERRWRAAQQAGLHEMPVVVRELDDRATFEIALIENIQRADLNPIEEAEGYARLVRDYGHSAEEIATAVGKSRSHVANLMRLLELPDDIRQMVIEGRLSMGHARTIIGHLDALALARKAEEQGWSVRQMEAAARKGAGTATLSPDSGRLATGSRDANLVALEQSLADALGTAVQVVPGDDKWSGTVVVQYSALDQLDMICQRLLGPSGRFD